MMNMLVTALSAGTASTGTSVISDAMRGVLTSGFQDLGATVTDVMTIAVPVAITCIALVAGVGFALKQLKGVLSQAS